MIEGKKVYQIPGRITERAYIELQRIKDKSGKSWSDLLQRMAEIIIKKEGKK